MKPQKRQTVVQYIKDERLVLGGGIIVGLILALGIWLVALNDLGARLATVGAFIAAIITPLLASIVNKFVRQQQPATPGTTQAPETSQQRLSAIVISAILALFVTVASIWLVPKGVSAFQTFMYQTYETETVQSSAILLKGNTHMADTAVATLTLPATQHRELKLRFSLKNTGTTSLCTNSATIKITGTKGTVGPQAGDTEFIVQLGEATKTQHTLEAQLLFLAETDRTCKLDLTVASATYYK